ncbi:MAG: hypothetical protein ABFS23_06980 [Pseudomonadota bacterium]
MGSWSALIMPSTPEVVCVSDLRSYFVESLRTAAHHQEVKVADATMNYLGGMMTQYTHAESLYERTPDGVVRMPLAMIYKSALESPSEGVRRLHLQRLGDVALFISGIFSGALRRGSVDVDYYVDMGEGAYGYLSENGVISSRDRALADIFRELARKFVAFGDLLAEVCENLRASEEHDLARLDELWERTGSRRLARKLRECGVVTGPRSRSLH